MIEVVYPRFEWLPFSEASMDGIAKHIELCGRNCYKSEDRITDDSAARFIKMLCRRGHESVLEHASLTARIICSRACSHQLVRHRLASISQESMRYINYRDKPFKVIAPPELGIKPGVYEHSSEVEPGPRANWLEYVMMDFQGYLEMLKYTNPENARFLLPIASKTEVVVTYNLRMWRHVIKTRIDPHAQWEIRGIMRDILTDLKIKLPAIFGDIE